MSYSVCINCEQMVPMYEKYCRPCLKRYPQLKQVADFWQSYHAWTDVKQIARDEIKGAHPEGGKE